MPRTTKGKGKHRDRVDYDALMEELKGNPVKRGERNDVPPQYRNDTHQPSPEQQEAHEELAG